VLIVVVIVIMSLTLKRQSALIAAAIPMFPISITEMISSYCAVTAVVIVLFDGDDLNGSIVKPTKLYVCIPAEPFDPIVESKSSISSISSKSSKSSTMTTTSYDQNYHLVQVGGMSYRGLIVDDPLVKKSLPCVSFADAMIPNFVTNHGKTEDTKHDDWRLFHCGPRIAHLSSDHKIWSIMDLYSQYRSDDDDWDDFMDVPHGYGMNDMINSHNIYHSVKCSVICSAHHGDSQQHSEDDDSNEADDNKKNIIVRNLSSPPTLFIDAPCSPNKVRRFGIPVGDGIFIMYDSMTRSMEPGNEVYVNVVAFYPNVIIGGDRSYFNIISKLPFLLSACVHVPHIDSILLFGYKPRSTFRNLTNTPCNVDDVDLGELFITSISSCYDKYKHKRLSSNDHKMNTDFMESYGIPPLPLDVRPRGASYNEDDHRLYIVCDRLYSILLDPTKTIKTWRVDSPVFASYKLDDGSQKLLAESEIDSINALCSVQVLTLC
jgi:hypothetical protein